MQARAKVEPGKKKSEQVTHAGESKGRTRKKRE